MIRRKARYDQLLVHPHEIDNIELLADRAAKILEYADSFYVSAYDMKGAQVIDSVKFALTTKIMHKLYERGVIR
jgi:hypothetical protein